MIDKDYIYPPHTNPYTAIYDGLYGLEAISTFMASSQSLELFVENEDGRSKEGLTFLIDICVHIIKTGSDELYEDACTAMEKANL